MPQNDDARYTQFQGLITALVWSCWGRYGGSPQYAQELTQVAWRVLLEDVLPRYDPQHPAQAKLSTYATCRLRGALLDYLEQGRVVRVPRSRVRSAQRQLCLEVERGRQHWTAQIGRAPTLEELATALGMAPEVLQDLEQHGAQKRVEVVALAASTLPACEPTPEETVATRQDQEHLHHCVQALPADLRTILLLKEVRGLSLRTIAPLVHLTKDTVQARLREAKARVQACLDASGEAWTPTTPRCEQWLDDDDVV